MKRQGLITVADLPKLLGNGPTRSTIAIARLDNKLTDARYGSFKITQADVDAWTKNLAEVFGGRVAIDQDHSSDRGGGTRAMGWITNIGQDGKLVTADVEWTKRGARAIRRGDYRHISPTFVQKYTDEHGVNRGRALLGAALTNRPVLRANMPALSLSRQPFDGFATSSQKAQTKTMGKTKKQKVTLSNPAAPTKADRKVIKALSRDKALSKSERRGWTKLLDALDKGERATAVANAWTPPNEPWMADVRALANEPAAPVEPLPDLIGDPEMRPVLHAEAKRLSKKYGADYSHGLEMAEHVFRGAMLARDTGEHQIEFLDSTMLSEAPKPWSDEDWQRDQRRALSAGISVASRDEKTGEVTPGDVDIELWRIHAEQGRDLIGELAGAKRAAALSEHRDAGVRLLSRARVVETDRRKRAALQRKAEQAANRARQQLLAREQASHGQSQAGTTGDGHSGNVVPW